MPRLLALLLPLAFLAPGAFAAECAPTTSETSGDMIVVAFPTTIPTQGDYLVIEPCDPGCAVWEYHETNGIPGLQRFDSAHDDTCGGMIEADTFNL